MTTLKDAERIVYLFGQLKGLNQRLAAIEDARATGTQFLVQFKVKNKDGNWGDQDGLKHQTTFQAGKLNNFAATFLGRLSDRVAAEKRKVERDLKDLGATP